MIYFIGKILIIFALVILIGIIVILIKGNFLEDKSKDNDKHDDLEF